MNEMKILNITEYTYTRMRETAMVTFKSGKLRRVKQQPIYRLRNDVWRFDSTDQPVKGINNAKNFN